MALDILLGLQWGDEGKGKIVDLMAGQYDIVARFQGGPNAGHTLQIKDKKFVFHTLPSGMIHDGVMNIIGTGMVIDPILLKEEIDTLRDEGIFDPQKLLIAKNAHLILPTHRLLDQAYENVKNTTKIGSTLKGIGPCYTDKMARIGLPIGASYQNDFKSNYKRLKENHLEKLKKLNARTDFDEKKWFEALDFIKNLQVTNTEIYLNDQLKDQKSILAEGAQGTLLDINYGTYPYVTSSSTIASSACLGLGLPPNVVNEIYGVFKAYTTRVGEGPFPTELTNDTGKKLQEAGNEYGATTGRPRRCGWLDLPGLNYAANLNGITKLIITKTDVFTHLSSSINLCTSFTKESEVEPKLIPYPDILTRNVLEENLNLEIKEFLPWSQDISSITDYDNLPTELKTFIEYLENALETPIKIISTGPKRTQYLFKDPASQPHHA